MKQPKKPLGLSKKVPAKRVMEIADSLNKIGYKKIAAGASSRIANDKVKTNVIKSGWKDIENSERYKFLVNKAIKKK
jgi:hypothetical protein